MDLPFGLAIAPGHDIQGQFLVRRHGQVGGQVQGITAERRAQSLPRRRLCRPDRPRGRKARGQGLILQIARLNQIVAFRSRLQQIGPMTETCICRSARLLPSATNLVCCSFSSRTIDLSEFVGATCSDLALVSASLTKAVCKLLASVSALSSRLRLLLRSFAFQPNQAAGTPKPRARKRLAAKAKWKTVGPVLFAGVLLTTMAKSWGA